MSDLSKCDAHLRPIDEEAELGSVSSVVARVDVITYLGTREERGSKAKPALVSRWGLRESMNTRLAINVHSRIRFLTEACPDRLERPEAGGR